MLTRICSACGMELPAATEYFYADKSVKLDGLASKCKKCRKVQMEKYKEENRELINHKARKTYEQNPEKTLARAKEYREKNKDKVRVSNHIYYQANKEHYAEYGKAYRENNPEKVRQRHIKYYQENAQKRKNYDRRFSKTKHGRTLKCLAGQRRRNLKKSLPVSFTQEDWIKCIEYFDHRCAYCGKEKPLTQEHFIPLSKGGEYTINNIIPACESCNKSKVNRDFFE